MGYSRRGVTPVVDEPGERWLPWRDGHYEVSSIGRVRRAKDATRVHSGLVRGVYSCAGRLLAQTLGRRDGYFSVGLSFGGERVTRTVHRLVADAFLGPAPDGMEVNHKNGVKTDNRVENLEYVTYRENILHAYRLGLNRPHVKRGEQCPSAKLLDAEVRSIRRAFAAGYDKRHIASKFGIHPATVGHIASWRYRAEAGI